jgi:hypothetical protein
MTRAFNKMTAAIAMQSDLSSNTKSRERVGIISDYDPNTHAVKVMLQPENVEAPGWIPLGAVGVGNGFGVVCAPNIGDMVQVTFTRGDGKGPKVTGRFFSSVNMPPVVPSGDTWIVHKSGNMMKFNGDGTILIMSPETITYQAQQHHFIGPVLMDNTLTGNQGIAISGDNGTGNASTVNGNFSTTGTITNNGHDIGSMHKHVNSGGSGLGGVPQ